MESGADLIDKEFETIEHDYLGTFTHLSFLYLNLKSCSTTAKSIV